MSELVVVGVDGSAGSAAALEHAAFDADRRGARLRVVSVVPTPEVWSSVGWTSVPTQSMSPAVFADAARDIAQRAVDELLATHPELSTRLSVEILGLPGHAAAELIAQSGDADMLVIGHRGRGALASTVLGSVGLSCVLHARCPVTVVRPTATGGPDEDGSSGSGSRDVQAVSR